MPKSLKYISIIVASLVLVSLLVIGAIFLINKTRWISLGGAGGGFSSTLNPMAKMPDISPVKENANVFAKTETNPYSYAYENPF